MISGLKIIIIKLHLQNIIINYTYYGVAILWIVKMKMNMISEFIIRKKNVIVYGDVSVIYRSQKSEFLRA